MRFRLARLRRRFRYWWNRDNRGRLLSEEMAFHLESLQADLIAQGMSETEAHSAAQRRFGNMTLTSEDARGTWITRWASDALQDFHYTLRTLQQNKGFAVFTLLIISLGIGASSTVFSVLNTLLARPLPFKAPQNLVWIANETKEENDLSGQTVQVGRMLDLRDRNHSFSEIAGYFAFYGTGDTVLTGKGEPERLSAVPVSQNFFPLLGVQPQIGRYFTADECKFNGSQAVMLSHGLWERRFGADPGIVGKTITLDGQPVIVAAVLPASFDFGSIFAPGVRIDLFTPFPLSKETDRWGNTLALVGRLKPGASIQQAQAEATVLGKQISSEHPRANYFYPHLSWLNQHVTHRIRAALVTLAWAVGLVMLIVCANLANLLLARTASRQQEMAIRAAVGAGRRRLIRQLLTEGVVLTCSGALFGLILAELATRGIAHLTTLDIPLLSEVRLDTTALGFTLLLAIGTGLLIGLAPALQVAALRLSASLGQRGSGGTQHQTHVRGALVISEIALACVLLVGAGLLIRSFVRLMDVDMGFRAENAGSVRIDPNSSYKTQAQRNAYFSEALSRVKAIAGVQGAGLTDVLPLGHNRTWGSPAKGQVYKGPDDFPISFVRIVSEGYVKAMGIRLKAGRDFTAYDTPASAPVIMINETLAHRLWPNQNPIGQVITGDCGADRQVVGVVGDVHHLALEKGSGSEMYLPIRQCQDYGSVDLVVRSTLSFPTMMSEAEATLRPIAPELPRASMRPLTALVDKAVSPRRFIVLLLGGFACFAVLLASLGIYGVISYSVNRRRQEIGIRIALGASSGLVQRHILMQTLGLAFAGMLIGATAALLLARSLNALLFGVTYGDPFTFALAAAVLLGAAGLAGYLPARRASRVDPVSALRVA